MEFSAYRCNDKILITLATLLLHSLQSSGTPFSLFVIQHWMCSTPTISALRAPGNRVAAHPLPYWHTYLRIVDFNNWLYTHSWRNYCYWMTVYALYCTNPRKGHLYGCFPNCMAYPCPGARRPWQVELNPRMFWPLGPRGWNNTPLWPTLPVVGDTWPDLTRRILLVTFFSSPVSSFSVLYLCSPLPQFHSCFFLFLPGGEG